MTNQAAQTMPTVPQAFFDEFGVNADDRVMDYGRACYAAALSQTAGVPDGWKLVPVEPTEAMCEAAMSSLGWSRSPAAATAAPITPASPMMEGSMKVWSAMLATAPAASAKYCSDERPCTPCFSNNGPCEDAPAASGVDTSTNEAWAARAQEKIEAMEAAASVSERDGSSAHCIGGGNWSPWDLFRLSTDMKLPVNLPAEKAIELRRDIERALEQALTQQRGEVEDEDYHVIMSMGRLLAEIAVILKGAEPAGTAWSYHDLPELVKSAVENAHDIASEMRAWAAVKMRERGSSRRDKMMVEEWSKRLLALPEVAFPVKDFDIPGLSITKEEIRFAIRKVVADRVFIGQDFGGTTPQPSADAVRDVPDGMVLVPREPTDAMVEVICDRHAGKSIWPDDYDQSAQAIRRRQARDGYRAMLSAASGEKGVG